MLNGHTFDMEHIKVPYANKCGETLGDQSLKKKKKSIRGTLKKTFSCVKKRRGGGQNKRRNQQLKW